MRIMFAIDCKFEHGELYRRFVANKQIMKQRYRMHTEYVKVIWNGLSLSWGSNEVISTQESRMSWVLSELTIRIFYLGILLGHKLGIFQVFHHKIFIWTLMTWTLIWEFHNELFSTRIFIWRIIIQTITKLLIISTICFFINLTSIVKFCRISTSSALRYNSQRPPQNRTLSAT